MKPNQPLSVLLLVKMNELFSPPPIFYDEFAKDGISATALQPDPNAPEDFVLKHGPDIDGLMILVDLPVGTRRVIEGLRRCRAIVRIGAGMESVDIPAANEHGIMVANTPDALVESVAEHALALFFCCLRRLLQHDRMLRSGTWNRSISKPMAGLRGQIYGMVGLGRIGRAVAQKVTALGLHGIAYDPNVTAAQAQALGVSLVSLEDLLRQADVISLHTALTPQTLHLIGEREFKLMKPSAIFVDINPGAVLDEQALIVALREGKLRAAGLDVFEKEPLASNSPLLTLDNVVLTPHVGAYSDTTHENMYRDACRLMADYLVRGIIPATILNPAPAFKPRRHVAATEKSATS